MTRVEFKTLFFPGLEYSPGEGMTYPPKFDSAPGKPSMHNSMYRATAVSFPDASAEGENPQR